MPEVTVVDTEMQLYIDDYTQMQAAATISPQLVLQVQVSNSINLQSAVHTTFTYEGHVLTGQVEGSQFGKAGNPAGTASEFRRPQPWQRYQLRDCTGVEHDNLVGVVQD